MNIEIPKEELERVARALMPCLFERPKLFPLLWQSLIAYAQFGNRDFINTMLKYVRTKDKLYLVEAKLHVSDCFTQLFLLCIAYEIDINEVISLGVERLKNHWKQEIGREMRRHRYY